MAKFKVVKGQMEEVPEPVTEGAAEVTKHSIMDRFKPAADAIKTDWEPFPEIDAPITLPPAPWVLIQKRAPRNKVGSIFTAGETQEVDGYREKVGKLLAVGSACYRNIDGKEAFGAPFKDWPKTGDMVLIPSSGGLDFTRTAKDGTKVTITMFHWRDVVGVVKDVAL